MKFQYFGHLMWRTDSLEKNPDAGKDWRQEEKRMTGDEMVWWHHQLDGYEFEQALGVGDEQETRHAVVHEVAMTEQLNWTLITSLWFLYSSTQICVWLGNLGETCLELYSRNECSRGHPLGTGQMWVDGEFWLEFHFTAHLYFLFVKTRLSWTLWPAHHRFLIW